MLDKNKYKTKKYLHFDNRIGIKNAESYVTDPKKISVHSFLPLICFEALTEKYYKYKDESEKRKDGRPIKEKTRKIMYSGHMDNYIYQYYAEILNNKYNEWLKVNKIDYCSTAYRNNKQGKSNIHFAAEGIDTICRLGNCYILIGDFKKFFDNLNHSVLKNRLAEILGVDYLSKDWYNVFKSLTKHAYYEKEILNEKLGTDKQFRARKELVYFKTVNEFREFRKLNPVKKNKKKIGIPQGTAISAVMANVYATPFDICINKIANQYNGLYRRYSDDFVLIIPQKSFEKEVTLEQFKDIKEQVYQKAQENHLLIQGEKTKLYEYGNFIVRDLIKNENSRIDYLGFVFDGVNVKMREKSIYKFYRKAYKLIDKAKIIKGKEHRVQLPYKKRIYGLYTDMGLKRYPYGNFLTYANNAQRIFDKECVLTTNRMQEQVKNRKQKIEKRMGMKIHT